MSAEVGDHGQVEGGGHPRLVNASLLQARMSRHWTVPSSGHNAPTLHSHLRPNEGADVAPPERGRLEDAHRLLAVRLGAQVAAGEYDRQNTTSNVACIAYV